MKKALPAECGTATGKAGGWGTDLPRKADGGLAGAPSNVYKTQISRCFQLPHPQRLMKKEGKFPDLFRNTENEPPSSQAVATGECVLGADELTGQLGTAGLQGAGAQASLAMASILGRPSTSHVLVGDSAC